jgi:DNA-binding transcriptional regulator YhcF (GntR family)
MALLALWIAEGSLAAGARLPSSRVLAVELGLARSTVGTRDARGRDAPSPDAQ